MFGTQQISVAGVLVQPDRTAPKASAEKAGRASLRARYEAAIPDAATDHWKFKDGLSAGAANSKGVRTELVQRSRYERDNNSIFNGMVGTYSTDVVGRGPRLQILLEDADMNRLIEGFFGQWADEVRLPPHLRTKVKAKIVDGETFTIKRTEPALECPVKLYPLSIECDQVQTMGTDFMRMMKGLWVDGIELSELGRPTYYHVLKQHPGDVNGLMSMMLEHQRVPAEYVLHWFDEDRPGQRRGIPKITPSLNRFAKLRRYDNAVLSAAEWAATMSALLFTDMKGDEDEDTPLGQVGDSLPIEPGGLNICPEGYKPSQLEPTQPAATYKEFSRSQNSLGARPMNMPYNVAACDSSEMNFSSGRLDMLPYWRHIGIERCDCEAVEVERLFAAWWAEAILIPGYIPDEIKQKYPLARMIPHIWHWPAMDSIDPVKDATATTENLANGTLTLSKACGANGDDWRDVMRQSAIEAAEAIELADELGLPTGWNKPKQPTPKPQPDEVPQPA